MITNEEARKAIEKYQKEHPLHFGAMIDVTAVSSKEGADIISQTIEKISKKIDEDTDLWCICEMAKMYMQGVKPVYPIRLQGKWIDHSEDYGYVECPFCHELTTCSDNADELHFCWKCGAEMRKGDES